MPLDQDFLALLRKLNSHVVITNNDIAAVDAYLSRVQIASTPKQAATQAAPDILSLIPVPTRLKQIGAAALQKAQALLKPDEEEMSEITVASQSQQRSHPAANVSTATTASNPQSIPTQPVVVPFDILARDELGHGYGTYVHKAIEFNTHPDIFSKLLQFCAIADPDFFRYRTVKGLFTNEGFGSYAYKHIIENNINPELFRIILISGRFEKRALVDFVKKEIRSDLPGHTRLHEAAEKGNARLVEIILELFEDSVLELLTLENHIRATPVHYAIQSCVVDVLLVMERYLLKHLHYQEQNMRTLDTASLQSTFAIPSAAGATEGSTLWQKTIEAKPSSSGGAVAATLATDRSTSSATHVAFSSSSSTAGSLPTDTAELSDPLVPKASQLWLSCLKNESNGHMTAFMYATFSVPKASDSASLRKCHAMLAYLKDKFAEDFSTLALVANVHGETPLHRLAKVGDTGLFSTFLSSFDEKSQPFLLLKTNNRMQTPVSVAARYGHSKLVIFCLDVLGDYGHLAASMWEHSPWTQLTLLHLVCRYCDESCIHRLLTLPNYQVEKDVSMAAYHFEQKDDCHQATPLLLAVVYGGYNKVKLFVQRKLINWSVLNEMHNYKSFDGGLLLLHFIAREGDPQTLELVVNALPPKTALSFLTHSVTSFGKSTPLAMAWYNRRYQAEMESKISALIADLTKQVNASSAENAVRINEVNFSAQSLATRTRNGTSDAHRAVPMSEHSVLAASTSTATTSNANHSAATSQAILPSAADADVNKWSTMWATPSKPAAASTSTAVAATHSASTPTTTSGISLRRSDDNVNE